MSKRAAGTYKAKCRLCLSLTLALTMASSSAGCRAPWYSMNSDKAKMDPLLVTESQRPIAQGPYTPRLRPGAPANLRTSVSATAPQPNAKLLSNEEDPETSSLDDVDDPDLQEYLAATPPQDLEKLRLTYQALSNRKMDSSKNSETFANKSKGATTGKPSDRSYSISDEESDSQAATVEELPADFASAEEAIELLSTKAANTNSQNTAGTENSNLSDNQSSRLPENPPAKPLPNPLPQTAVKSPTKRISDTYVAKASAEAPRVEADAPPSGRNVDPSPSATKADWHKLVHEAIAAAQAEHADTALGQSPEQKLHREASIRMLSLVVGDLNAALEPLKALQENEREASHSQEYFRNQMQALHDAIDPQGNPVLGRRWTIAMQSQRKAHAHLAAVSNLEVQNVTFCTAVDSYGIITKFPQYHFRSDQELLLYCELDNFVAEPVKDGFQTQLQGSYEIVDTNGRRVADQLLPMDEHVCRNQRRDYFIAYRVYMPNDIQPGSYHLKLTIEDMKGRKFGQSNVDFQIVK